MSTDKAILSVLIGVALFALGIYVFNHSTIPLLGIIIAVVYPAFLIRKFFKSLE